MTRSFTFLVNPASGGGAAPEAVVPVARILRDAEARVDVTYSPGPRAMERLVDEALARDDVVVSVGGDGMLASLAGLVSRRGGTLGLVPAGRGNDFARMLGLPETPDRVADVLLRGEVRGIDLLELGDGRRVAGSVYAGVDARAAELVDGARWMPGVVQYPYAAVRALLGYRPGRFRVVVDGVVGEYDAATVVVANSAYYGKGMRIAPSALVEDGLLDVVVIEAASRRALIRALPTVYDGRHVERPEVTVLRGRRVEVAAAPLDGPGTRGRRRAEGLAVPVGGDGEPLGELPGLAGDPLVVEVVPAALQVVVGARAPA